MIVGSRKRRSRSGWRSFPLKLQRAKTLNRAWSLGFKLLGLLLASSLIWVSLLYAGKGAQRSSRPSTQNEFSIASRPSSDGEVPQFAELLEGKYIEERQSYRFVYTVVPLLQQSVMEIFRIHRPPFGTFVAIEPKTGKILALADYAREHGGDGPVWQRATYPAASIFKLITAAGALEKGLLNYDSPVSFRGNQYRLGPQKIGKSSKRERQTQFDEALGKSNNVVFGRVASKLVGSQTLRYYCEAFGFNQSLPFDFPTDRSRASIPEDTYELARCGAGLGEVTLNPLHAAMIAACIANAGTMMRPYLIEQIIDSSGETIYQAKAETLGRPIKAKTALDLSRMMLRTVEDGTASKIFQRHGKALLKKMSICGKTGSLTGHNPRGFYDWFVGFAPGDDPQIAFSAMVIIHERWKIKGTFVAQEALKTFFREEIN